MIFPSSALLVCGGVQDLAVMPTLSLPLLSAPPANPNPASCNHLLDALRSFAALLLLANHLQSSLIGFYPKSWSVELWSLQLMQRLAARLQRA